jgi:hypothetical protein
MRTLSGIEDMIYHLVNTQFLDKKDVELDEIMNISKTDSKNNSLSD